MSDTFKMKRGPYVSVTFMLEQMGIHIRMNNYIVRSYMYVCMFLFSL